MKVEITLELHCVPGYVDTINKGKIDNSEFPWLADGFATQCELLICLVDNFCNGNGHMSSKHHNATMTRKSSESTGTLVWEIERSISGEHCL